MFSYTIVVNEDLRFSMLWTGNFKFLLLEKQPTDDLRKPELCKDRSNLTLDFYTRAEEKSDSHHNKY